MKKPVLSQLGGLARQQDHLIRKFNQVDIDEQLAGHFLGEGRVVFDDKDPENLFLVVLC